MLSHIYCLGLGQFLSWDVEGHDGSERGGQPPPEGPPEIPLALPLRVVRPEDLPCQWWLPINVVGLKNKPGY